MAIQTTQPREAERTRQEAAEDAAKWAAVKALIEADETPPGVAESGNGEPIFDDCEERPTQWENPIPFSDDVRQGTWCRLQFIIRWNSGGMTAKKRGFVCWHWRRLAGRRVVIDTTEFYYVGTLVGFDGSDLDILGLGDMQATSVAWKNILSIGEYVPVDPEAGPTA